MPARSMGCICPKAKNSSGKRRRERERGSRGMASLLDGGVCIVYPNVSKYFVQTLPRPPASCSLVPRTFFCRAAVHCRARDDLSGYCSYTVVQQSVQRLEPRRLGEVLWSTENVTHLTHTHTLTPPLLLTGGTIGNSRSAGMEARSSQSSR